LATSANGSFVFYKHCHNGRCELTALALLLPGGFGWEADSCDLGLTAAFSPVLYVGLPPEENKLCYLNFIRCCPVSNPALLVAN